MTRKIFATLIVSSSLLALAACGKPSMGSATKAVQTSQPAAPKIGIISAAPEFPASGGCALRYKLNEQEPHNLVMVDVVNPNAGPTMSDRLADYRRCSELKVGDKFQIGSIGRPVSSTK